ncbi:MAG: ferric reductase-like transmembrane domain-containing protein [Phenylobacterium sp.]|uniref:ferric reductase-like transmembrane domain-containing protein n=1 Tax=Phenylobacterium sp. TaxID=1871053 RepID=UPI001A4BB315|nr:ferric reductase-like transmembrane domain-containing protein [Phenylobacterium sp.]MBL8772369.1 ferric reductase-like transmembrane domain-containing protein [Phenylobacterium sp.]
MKLSPPQLLLWGLLSVPGVWIVARHATGALGYGEAIQLSGEWAVRLLVVVLAVTGLRLAFPRAGWTVWLLRRRRDLGVAVFGYALLHLGVYLARKAEMPVLIVREALDPGMAVGWVGFVVFAVLAITSNDASVRALGPRWRILHRMVYAGAALTIAHWVITAFDPLVGWIHGGVLAAVILVRLALRRKTVRAG